MKISHLDIVVFCLRWRLVSAGNEYTLDATEGFWVEGQCKCAWEKFFVDFLPERKHGFSSGYAFSQSVTKTFLEQRLSG